jgi:hypothetical protein
LDSLIDFFAILETDVCWHQSLATAFYSRKQQDGDSVTLISFVVAEMSDLKRSFYKFQLLSTIYHNHDLLVSSVSWMESVENV